MYTAHTETRQIILLQSPSKFLPVIWFLLQLPLEAHKLRRLLATHTAFELFFLSLVLLLSLTLNVIIVNLLNNSIQLLLSLLCDLLIILLNQFVASTWVLQFVCLRVPVYFIARIGK